MRVSSEVRKQAISALCRRDGYGDLRNLFVQGRIDKKFAENEIRRSIYIFERHFMIGKLSQATEIEERKVKEIARTLCFGLMKTAEFKLKISMAGEAAEICERIADIISDYGFVHDKELWDSYHDVHMRTSEQITANWKEYEHSQPTRPNRTR